MPLYPLVIGSISAGTTRALGPEVVLSNLNGISFGANGSTITASHNALTSQSNQAVSAANGSFAFQTLVLSNLNGVSFGTDAGSVVTASYTVPVETPFGISAGTQSVSTGTLVFSNSNGITFGMSGSSRITASHDGLTSQSAQAASASNGSFAFQTLAFSNANGITFGTSAGSIISASHNGLTAQSAQAASASNGSFAFETLGFSNANGVTFGTSAGSIITASVDAAGGGLTNIRISAGTSSAHLSALTFSDSNGLSFGLNGSTVTASPMKLSFWEASPVWHGWSINNGSMSIQRVFIPNPIDATRLDFIMGISGSNSGAASLSIAAALYTMNVSTAGTVHSTTRGITYQSTSAQSFTNHSGTRYHSLAAPWNVTPGEYVFCFVIASTSASTNSTVSIYGKSSVSLNAASTTGGNFSAYWAHGYLTAATSNVPATMHLSDLRQTGNLVLAQPYFRLVGTF